MTAIAKPAPADYAPYFSRYIDLVTSDDIITTLQEQMFGTIALLRGLSEGQGDLRYAPEKWSVKELIGHIIDTERIFAYRALRFARGDRTALAGFEQDDYITHGNFAARTLADLTEEYETVRRATLTLFRPLDAEAWQRRGVANDWEMSAQAAAYAIAGHELHHLKILRERYL